MCEEYAACIVLRLTAYHPDTTTVSIVGSVSFIASEAIVLLSTWWSTYGIVKIARTSNHDVSLTYLLLRDGELLLLHRGQSRVYQLGEYVTGSLYFA